ncbi:glycoside hydrolase domain-containing protein [Streptomyces sp. NPDC006700]|uniref:glycoside hydrolase domain-containing protein n=2 Tax=unclassified Streptomyces TaxID=2593676 RepID=UPI0033E3B0C0
MRRSPGDLPHLLSVTRRRHPGNPKVKDSALDAMVLEAQKWVNATYSGVAGYNKAPEDGKTGWLTMYSLTRALQHELGITALSDSFGPGTLSALTARGGVSANETNQNIIKIAQCACYCKGYDGGGINGNFSSTLGVSIAGLMNDAGLGGYNGSIQPKVFKALLTMDAYILLAGGTEEVRTIQRWLNGRYINKSTFFVMPADGHYTRDVQTGLMKALQYEFGIAEDSATGNFGPATQQGLRDHPVAQGSSGVFVQLFSAACVFNGRVGGRTASFTNTFDSDLTSYVHDFQGFSALPVSNRGDYATWAQLLVSTGDPDRDATACDTSRRISAARAQSLYKAGYRFIGRYLAEEPQYNTEKPIAPGELDAIFSGNLRVFPIWQYGARSLDDFKYTIGFQHALLAHEKAAALGLNKGVVIYFAVDYDATDPEITSNIVPYFNGVQSGLASKGKRYIAGVYGSRNVCSRVTDEAYARFSFVSGMSWGFSGNLGFPMPSNWSFTQIKEFTFAAGGDSFPLDNDVYRPKSDPGVGRDEVGGTEAPTDAYLQYIDDLYACAVRYNKGNPSLRVMEFLRYPTYVDLYSGWQTLIGDVDRDWIAYATANGPKRQTSFKDPSYGISYGVDHFGATANGYYLKGAGSGTGANRGDFAGWGGDLTTFYADWRNNADEYASGYQFCTDRLAKINVASSFAFDDLIEDVDGYLVGMAVRDGAKINEVIRDLIGGTGHLRRFKDFYTKRHGGSVANVTDTARTMLIDVGDDDILDAIRTAAIRKLAGVATMLPGYMPSDKLNPFLSGYADTIQRIVGNENAKMLAYMAKNGLKSL